MNRRMRNRMYGGVGGRRAQARPLPDPSESEGRGRQPEQSLRAHQLIKSLSAVEHLALSNIVKRSPSSALIHVLD